MIRWTLAALIVCGAALSMVGCTHTVRGIGQDLNSPAVENYNNRTASDIDY